MYFASISKFFQFSVITLAIGITSCQSDTAQHSEDAVQQDVLSEDGFKNIFDEKTLSGWDGDTTVWRVEDNNIVGEVTAEKPLRTNTFLIWQGGSPGDFELKAEVKITEKGNSGINYRSELVEGVPFGLKGYQADMDGKHVYTGLTYEERGRGMLAKRGETVTLENGKDPIVHNAANPDSLLQIIRQNDWNEIHIVAKGNHLIYYLNGTLVSETTDNDTVNRKAEGLIGLQAHVGPPMTVRYRNIRIK